MKIKTQYIAPLSLWLVVRKRFSSNGLFVEPAWIGNGKQNGPLIFTSRILASFYAHVRNKYHQKDDSDNWRVIPMHEFDLLQHVRDCDGELWCMMGFGVTLEEPGSIIVTTGAPRTRYAPLYFAPPTDNDDVTLLFSQWVFDFIADEFKSIGLPKYDEELESIDEMDDATFAATLNTAIGRANICREPTARDRALWGVYSPLRDAWISGEDARCDNPAERTARTMH
ncbi:hypothetical protein [Paraburkholderia oxyphila]|uniref:hypothetical protein n=1 Tax=Paraburkholderia oxyphila TaxID=614212 RepID=UPI0004842D33|nr:hypothetical protein [Paraburkholderia oxyphila]